MPLNRQSSTPPAAEVVSTHRQTQLAVTKQRKTTVKIVKRPQVIATIRYVQTHVTKRNEKESFFFF